ncbi:MAG: hypothetical protein H0V22_02600 [Solirubrobacterales bacterium]|nr:hypothetical protein [Solirubrobacterales bacterium]
MPIIHRDESVGVLKVFSPRPRVRLRDARDARVPQLDRRRPHTRANNYEVVQRQSRQDLLAGWGTGGRM